MCVELVLHDRCASGIALGIVVLEAGVSAGYGKNYLNIYVCAYSSECRSECTPSPNSYG